MRSSSLWRGGAIALLALVLSTSAIAHAEEAAEEDSGPPPDGAVEIPYLESGEIRPAEGWLIDCAQLEPMRDVRLVCEPEAVSLTAVGYDPDWGEHPLPVTLRSAHTSIDVTYRVRMAPPDAPVAAVSRFDLPIAVGAQAMIPLAGLGITCTLCSEEGGATIRVGELPPGVEAGVSETHLTVRGSFAGDAAIPLELTDDAGQTVSAELTVSFLPGLAADAGALHVVAAGEEWDLAELSWGEDIRFFCGEPRPAALSCAPDGTAALPAGDGGPGQFLFRIVTAAGAQSWGSVTVDPAADGQTLAVPSWAGSAPLVTVYPPPGEEDQAVVGGSLLGPLLLLMEGMSGS